ncbi:hypothetical protein SAMN05428988_3615 [Chitinophaga sp. YR573]|uniref:hypothetical protein n=1 Tax=Chitinophaga sp. YR573 TaxID=1881040 RepID=UPI0008BD643A|nr:hypothetical protein [Chitinophaga sp. YR573]SEW25239.1 hypothetical protein SAMN05428988_3615 [Chitinophaga sp. YR573]
MNKGAFYRYAGIIIILLIVSLKSWGSVTLPQLNHKAASTCLALQDSIPPRKPVEAEQKQEQPVTDAVIKEVPKAKKQIKPIAVPTTVLPVKAPIVKPKIVIRKIGVRIP